MAKPWHDMDGVTLYHGDALSVLRTMPAESVQTCVSSPPYWGLRDYGLPPLVWGGNGCAVHQWQDASWKPDRWGAHDDDKPGAKQQTNGGSLGHRGSVKEAATCSVCGAWRGSLGLEPTPELFVAHLVEVYREVRRVLKPDGCIWVNLGDSYASGAMTDRELAGERSGQTLNGRKGYADNVCNAQRRAPIANGLKPKDLVGVPWMVAFALRQPYYTGRIRDERDRIWLAAMLDAEGCMFIHRRKAGQHNGQGYYRQNDNYAPGVEICNTSEAVVERIMRMVGKGSICKAEAGQHQRKQNLYRWNLRTTESRDFVRELYPHLVAKQHQARLLCGCPSSGKDAERAHVGLIALHRGNPTDIDFKAPEPMWEPGFYLRQDIIWSKPNPMPESVTDRCTKAHEYLFLLSKSERYFYDQEAVMERGADSSVARLAQDIENQTGSTRANGGAKTNGNMKAVRQHKQMAMGRCSSPGSSLGSNNEPLFRNRRSVWTVTTQPFKEAHFATFPPDLIEPCIKAGSRPGDVVLDPFNGSGTTGAVAQKWGRRYVGIELNESYLELTRQRFVQRPLFPIGEAV